MIKQKKKPFIYLNTFVSFEECTRRSAAQWYTYVGGG